MAHIVSLPTAYVPNHNSLSVYLPRVRIGLRMLLRRESGLP